VTKLKLAIIPVLGVLFAAFSALPASVNPGHVNYVANLTSAFDQYTSAPNTTQQQWFRSHFSSAEVYTTYFDTRTSWFPNAYFYQDLYGILQGSSVLSAHPEWILRDQYGNWLFMPYSCSGGTCPLYAGDVANAAFRSYWVSEAAATFARGNYPGMFVDDVNMQFQVSDGWGNLTPPIDSNTGQVMTYAAWRNYIAMFVEQIRAAFPNAKIVENVIWYAGPAGVYDADPAIQRQIATATSLNLERGVASDTGLTGGTGFYSVYSFFNFVDRVHAAGKGVNFQEYSLNAAGQQYGLASYFMISTGNDSIGDQVTTPNNWWKGYDVDLGAPLGPRTYNNGVFQRNFSGGIVLLGEPGLSPTAVNLGGIFTTLSGASVISVTISGQQGIVLRGTTRSRPRTPA